MDTLTNQDKINVANDPNLDKVIALLMDTKTKIPSLIAEDSFKTNVNAITMEVEASFVARFVQYINDIKLNKFHD